MRTLALIAAVAAFITTPAFAAGYGDFTGRWRNNDPDTSDLTRLRIRFDGDNLDVRAWGQCHPRDCDWGTVDAVAYSPSPAGNPSTSATEIIAVYNPGFARKTLILTARPGDRLSYAIYTRFRDGSGRRPYVVRGTLRKFGGRWPDWPPGGPGWPPGEPGEPGEPGDPGEPEGPGGGLSFSEDCVNLDWRDVEARFVGGEWKVVEDDHWMLSFGSRASEARRAANIIRHYRFTQHCFIGRPESSMDYWKRGDDMPTGGYAGQDCVGNSPDSTRAVFRSGQWRVVDGDHLLMSFGSKGREARRAAEVIRHYGLNRHCFVGRPGPSMNYWLAQ